MYIDSVINDYAERNDFDVSSFQYLVNMAEDYRNREEMDKLNEELNNNESINNEINDLPF